MSILKELIAIIEADQSVSKPKRKKLKKSDIPFMKEPTYPQIVGGNMFFNMTKSGQLADTFDQENS